ncbi:NAC domain-containing protein 67 [Eucalyptus grandis]|uniref:NAC domain-containing protein 67 n=1 Tax=Eucalyptus grandis TaxID=71139 RepID=UPI00192EF6BE|nr:NAC domain-containing protein 67 [Eucalyptus grandis]
MNSLAKYRPTDECLITDYLQPKVMGKPLPLGQIDECDLYSQEPWKIFNTTLELKQTFYVFTELTKMGSRNSRTVGSGTWKGQHLTKIFNDGGDFLGYKKSFKFQEGGGPSATSGRWIMKEFSMCDERCNYVLCKIEYFRDDKSKDKEIVTSDDVLVQSKDNNRQAKRACLLHNSGDRTSIVALPSATVDGVQPATAQAYAEQLQMSMAAAPALHLDNDDLAFTGLSGDAIDARSVAPGPDIGNLTSPAFGDTGDTTYPAFDNGPYADLLPLTVEDYTNYPYADLLPLTVEDYTNYPFEVDANYLFGSNPFANKTMPITSLVQILLLIH